MLFTGELHIYRRCSSWPEKRTIAISLKDDLRLTLDIPDFGVTDCTNELGGDNSSSRIVLAHAAFRAAMQLVVPIDDAFSKICAAEVNAISLLFPDVGADLRIVFTAWFAFACVLDDILEGQGMEDREQTLVECIDAIELALGSSPQQYGLLRSTAEDERITRMARVLCGHCTRYLSEESAAKFFNAIWEVLQAHLDEIDFLQSGSMDSLPTYMNIRRRTIALNPLFEVIKSEYLNSADMEFKNVWEELQNEVSRAAGLQNDLIGLVRDLEDGEQLNSVMVLMRGFRTSNSDQLEHDILPSCVALVNAEHNQSIARCFEYMTQLHRAAENAEYSSIRRVETVARHIIMLCETHLRWCASAKRYRLDVGINGDLPYRSQQDVKPEASSSSK